MKRFHPSDWRALEACCRPWTWWCNDATALAGYANLIAHHVWLSAILLGSIKVPYTELKRRILEVDESQLEVAQVEQLIRYMPEPEQMSQLAALKDEYDSLAEAEQFGVVVRAIMSSIRCK